jgi:hypothetical protein
MFQSQWVALMPGGRFMKKKQPATAKPAAAKKLLAPLTQAEIVQRLEGTGKVWRNRQPGKQERGVPVKPGAARSFVHSF